METIFLGAIEVTVILAAMARLDATCRNLPLAVVKNQTILREIKAAVVDVKTKSFVLFATCFTAFLCIHTFLPSGWIYYVLLVVNTLTFLFTFIFIRVNTQALRKMHNDIEKFAMKEHERDTPTE